MSADLQGRNGVVFGVANKRSIAWSIAQGLHAAGMKLAITYQNERLEQEAKDLILSLPGAEAYMCDVSKDEEIARLFAKGLRLDGRGAMQVMDAPGPWARVLLEGCGKDV